LYTLLDAARSNWGREGEEDYDKPSIGLVTASMGIASTLLKHGQTFHSTVKAPCIDLNAESCFPISAGSELARVFRDTHIFVWDEVSMAHKHLTTSLDSLIKDIMQDERHFGGKLMESWWSRVENIYRTCPLSQADQRHKLQMHV
jgi:hypothetical protein